MANRGCGSGGGVGNVRSWGIYLLWASTVVGTQVIFASTGDKSFWKKRLHYCFLFFYELIDLYICFRSLFMGMGH